MALFDSASVRLGCLCCDLMSEGCFLSGIVGDLVRKSVCVVTWQVKYVSPKGTVGNLHVALCD